MALAVRLIPEPLLADELTLLPCAGNSAFITYPFENMSLYRWPSFPLESSFFGFRLLVTQVQVRLVG